MTDPSRTDPDSDPDTDPGRDVPGDATAPRRVTGSGQSTGGASNPAVRRQMRISDAERNAANEALTEHLTSGRITLDEFGERSARVTVAKTAGDLTLLFDDLPAPHPRLAQGVAATPTSQPATTVADRSAAADPPADVAPADTRSTAQKLTAAAAAASVFVALGLFFLTGLWYWFLLIPAVSAVASAIWGKDWKEPHAHRDQRRGHGDRS